MPKLKRRATPEAATARSRCYQFLSRAFTFPQADFFDAVKSGRWWAETSAILTDMPYPLSLPARAGAVASAPDYDAFQAEYIRLFEVGPRGGPPCPLHSGHYARDRLRVMEELVRFFNFFGLRLSPGRLPDHITVELEFMHYLAFKEAEAREGGGDLQSYLRAQRDFLDRHLANWLPRLNACLRRQRPPPFYRALVALTARFLERDRRYLGRLLAGGG